MGFLDFLKGADINQGIKEYEATPGAVLLDARSAQEYLEGHIPGSKNIPLDSIARVQTLIGNRDTPIFVYCYSGSRSRQAAGMLGRMGYADVRNVGGIADWIGRVEH